MGLSREECLCPIGVGYSQDLALDVIDLGRCPEVDHRIDRGYGGAPAFHDVRNVREEDEAWESSKGSRHRLGRLLWPQRDDKSGHDAARVLREVEDR